MPEELFPSSYKCDCGHQSDFGENTVRDMKRMSKRKRVRLADDDGHTIVFYLGEMEKIICPNQKKKEAIKKKSTSQKIPEEIKNQVEKLITRFNQKTIKNPDSFYVPRYRGRFLYLDRNEAGELVPICRLEYNGKINNWSFAIYKYSDEKYNPNEFMFPGMNFVNGTILGAMKAGLKAYPL